MSYLSPTTTGTNDLLLGRQKIYTDLKPSEVTAANLIEDLKRVLGEHERNAQDITFLQNYHRGYHPAIENRVKTTRVDIDNKITINYPYSSTRDIVGYFLGKNIQYAHSRGSFPDQMEKLQRSMTAENKGLVDFEIAQDGSICGIGVRGIFPDKQKKNGTGVSIIHLNPTCNFVVYSSDPTVGAVYAVSFYQTQGSGNGLGVETIFTIYSHNKKFIAKAPGVFPMGIMKIDVTETTDTYLGGNLPIVEYPNNQWRLGDWEVAISIIDALDATASDGVNDIQQAVNAILLAVNLDINGEDLHNGAFVSVKSVEDSKNIFFDFVSNPMDSAVGVSMREYLESTYRVIVGVPDRKTRGGGGGDTGDAVFMRDGWQDIDLVASGKEPYFIEAERNSLAAILSILQTNGEIGKTLKAADIDIHFNRNKTANIQSKVQVLATLDGLGFTEKDSLDIAEISSNPFDVANRWIGNKEKVKAEAQEQLMMEAELTAENTEPADEEPEDTQQTE
jgi:SPP1 family phage portal protein